MGRLYLSSPTMHGEEMKYIQEAFDRNWIAPLGFNCDGFEEELNSYLGGEMNALALASGTGALHLAMIGAGVKPGDVVICSDMTFSATVNPVAYVGGKQVFVDSERDTWNMDPEALELAFEKYPEAKFVDLVHLYGTPSHIDEISDICKKHGAVLIEDAAEALGAEYKGKKCGNFGEFSALSFNGNKIITTSGGGMLLTKSKEQRDRALFRATQAREKAPWYQHEEIGYNYRMSNVVAGIGRGQLLYLDAHRDLKEKIYRRYEAAFAGMPVHMNPYLECSKPNFWLSCITIDPNVAGKAENGGVAPIITKIMNALAENDVESRPIWKPMHMQPVYSNFDFIKKGSKAVNEEIFENGLCLPSDIKMTPEQQDMVIDIVKGCIK